MCLFCLGVGQALDVNRMSVIAYLSALRKILKAVRISHLQSCACRLSVSFFVQNDANATATLKRNLEKTEKKTDRWMDR